MFHNLIPALPATLCSPKLAEGHELGAERVETAYQ
jgi:hypothetical protein